MTAYNQKSSIFKTVSWSSRNSSGALSVPDVWKHFINICLTHGICYLWISAISLGAYPLLQDLNFSVSVPNHVSLCSFTIFSLDRGLRACRAYIGPPGYLHIPKVALPINLHLYHQYLTLCMSWYTLGSFLPSTNILKVLYIHQ